MSDSLQKLILHRRIGDGELIRETLTGSSLTVMPNADAWAKISALTIAPAEWIWTLSKTWRLNALKAQSMSRILVLRTLRTRIFQPQANKSLCGGSCLRAR